MPLTLAGFEHLIELSIQRLEWVLEVERAAAVLEDRLLAIEALLDPVEPVFLPEDMRVALIEEARTVSTQLLTVYHDPVDPPVAALRQVPFDMICAAVARQHHAEPTERSVWMVIAGIAERWNGRPFTINLQASNVFESFPWGKEKY